MDALERGRRLSHRPLAQSAPSHSLSRVSRRIWIIIFLAASLYLLGNGRVQLWDRDEPRYAQASRQMLQSGDWVVPRLLDEPRIKKPPLIYWCQAGCMALLGDNAFAARLPSVIAMVLTLMLVGSTLARIADEPRAFWAVLVMGTSGLVIMAAKMCLTDAVLLLFVTAGQLMLYAMWLGQRDWWTVIVFAAATGLALLTKGPVVLGVNGMTLVVLGGMRLWEKWRKRKAGDVTRQSRPCDGLNELKTPQLEEPSTLVSTSMGGTPMSRDGVRPGRVSSIFKVVLAIVIILGIGLPWAIAMQMRLPGGLTAVFNKEVLQRMSEPLEQHKGPPGYYLAFFFASFFPWCLLLPTAIKWAWRKRSLPLVRFSLAAVIGPWIMFEAIQTKLPHYVLPCMPFLAILVAEVIVGATQARKTGAADDEAMSKELTARGFLIAVGVWAVIVAALGLMPWVAALPGFAFDRLPYIAMGAVSIIAIGSAIGVMRIFIQKDVERGALAMAGTMFALFAVLFGWYLPRARFLHLSEEVGKFLREGGAVGRGNVYMIDYKEDSLPFYQGGTIRPQPKNAFLSQAAVEDWPEFLTITREIWDQTPESARANLRVLRTFRGWAYAAKGRIVEVMVVMKKPE